MRAFSAAEAEYLESKRLGRLATVGKDGSPQVVPVGFRLNREFKTIDVGGHSLARTKRYADVVRERRAAIVIDEVLPSLASARDRGARQAEVLDHEGEAFGAAGLPRSSGSGARTSGFGDSSRPSGVMTWISHYGVATRYRRQVLIAARDVQVQHVFQRFETRWAGQP